MFAKQTIWSASLVAVLGAAQLARAEGEGSAPHSDDEVRPPLDSEPTPDEVHPPGDSEPTPVEVAPAREPPPAWAPAVDHATSPEPANPPEIQRAPVEPEPPADPKYTPAGRFMLGAGFSTIEGFIAKASIEHNNVFRTGNQLALHASVSARRQLFLLRFADPDVLGSKLALSADLYNVSRPLPGFHRNAAGSSLTLSHPVGDNLRAFIGYRIEEVETSREALFAARTLEPLPPLASGVLSALRTGLVFSTLDNPYAPLRGSSIGTSIEVADRRLGSDLQFTKLETWAHTHQPLGPFTLHLRGAMTSITGRSGAVPMSERLFLDNASELRGYRPETFTPMGPLGNPLGGDVKLVGSVELEVPLVRRLGLSAVGFADFGGLFDRGGDSVVGRSVGFGLLWRSPIGPLRFDWAFTGGGAPSFIFGIGSPF